MTYIVRIKEAHSESWAAKKIGQLFHAYLWDHHNKNERRQGNKIFVGILPEYGWLPESACEVIRII